MCEEPGSQISLSRSNESSRFSSLRSKSWSRRPRSSGGGRPTSGGWTSGWCPRSWPGTTQPTPTSTAAVKARWSPLSEYWGSQKQKIWQTDSTHLCKSFNLKLWTYLKIRNVSFNAKQNFAMFDFFVKRSLHLLLLVSKTGFKHLTIFIDKFLFQAYIALTPTKTLLEAHNLIRPSRLLIF